MVEEQEEPVVVETPNFEVVANDIQLRGKVQEFEEPLSPIDRARDKNNNEEEIKTAVKVDL